MSGNVKEVVVIGFLLTLFVNIIEMELCSEERDFRGSVFFSFFVRIFTRFCESSQR